MLTSPLGIGVHQKDRRVHPAVSSITDGGGPDKGLELEERDRRGGTWPPCVCDNFVTNRSSATNDCAAPQTIAGVATSIASKSWGAELLQTE
jgi:hypothetical protein